MRHAVGTIRVRTTLAAVVVVGVAMLVGGVTLVTVLRQALTDDTRAAARVRAAELVLALEAGQGPPSLAVVASDEELLQVVDAGGSVIASSPNVAGLGAVTRLPPGGSAEIGTPIDGDTFLAVAASADTSTGRVTVIVARALADVFESTRLVTRLLLIGLPLLLILVGLTTWVVVGRTLAPVEAIRREVEEISAAQLHRRVPQTVGSDEITRLATTMNRMLGRLQRAQATQRRFLSDASHELRSPVAAIRQHTEVALAHPGRTSTSDLARTVLAENLRVQRLVEDLLVLARADEDALDLGRHPVDVDDLVFDEARRLRTAAGPVRVDTTAVSAGRVLGDAVRLRRVVRNLGDNAVRHARGAVTFGLVARGRTVLLSVDDDGPGIPAAERERVFERFVRLDDARTRDHGGSGLGLAIVAELVRAHGGSVSVADSALGGARFEVRLPGPDDAAPPRPGG